MMSEAISGAELRVWCSWLGLTRPAAAQLLGVSERTLKYWISGEIGVPAHVGVEMEHFEEFTAEAVNTLISALHAARDPGVVIYRTDAEMWAERPDFRPWPASWWISVVARATAEVPGVEIAYPDGQT